ncbi:MAG TPA: iron chelate uptake ABC transporter family permease subunit [Saprospiraceae bacterium]|nr:iron chelate uptake ABC transporter family permease subunit [Saprospiraceae bacterium]
MEFLEVITSPWALRALAASGMVGILCGAMGCFIVLRNMSLIGDALSHAVLPGIFVAFLILGYSAVGFFAGSVAAGLITALLITWIQQNTRTKNDAAIGIVFTAMFSLGVMGISWLSKDRGAHLDLKDFLFGNVLGISNEDLILTFFILGYTLISIWLFFRYLMITTFQPVIAQTMGISVKAIHYFLMLLLSFAVVSALRSVGVILVVAMLITPASTALLLSDRLVRVVFLSAVIGFFSAIGGMLAAIVFDTTPGPAMVVFATMIYFFAAIFAPEKGYFTKILQKREQKMKVDIEDIIKLIYKENGEVAVPVKVVREKLDFALPRLTYLLKKLEKANIVSVDANGDLVLTQKGEDMALRQIRAHRLWESYQVETMGLDKKQIHGEAEILEHLLTDDLLDEVDAKLGFPKEDPHGSPIPPKFNIRKDTLLYYHHGAIVRVLKDQVDKRIESELWEMGIMPSSVLHVMNKQDLGVTVKAGNKIFELDNPLAARIRVEPVG